MRALVVSSKAVDAGLDENQAVLGVPVLLVLLQVLADADGLADQGIDVFRDLWSAA